MGGYNTVSELLSLRRPALIVPRVVPRQEQLIRAQALSRRGLVRMLHPGELTPLAFCRRRTACSTSRSSQSATWTWTDFLDSLPSLRSVLSGPDLLRVCSPRASRRFDSPSLSPGGLRS